MRKCGPVPAAESWRPADERDRRHAPLGLAPFNLLVSFTEQRSTEISGRRFRIRTMGTLD